MNESSFPRSVAVLGSSGSIGQSTLEVLAESEGRLVPILLSVHRQTDILVEQIRQMRQPPQWIVITDETADRSPLAQLPKGIEIFFGHEALCELVRRPEVDVVLSAIVGSAGLTSTLSALEAGKTVALANKESLVMGGELLTNLVNTHGGRLLPVDSEHSAVMQALRACALSEPQSEDCGPRPSGRGSDSGFNSDSVNKIILTASGGPFRTRSLAELANVTVADALAHPTWKMGKKITIDSATLMNKALEIIEARWFFDVPAEKIGVVIHPQSLVHSMVEFIDGSVIAQMSPPDMRLPIQLALDYPHRFPSPALKVDWMQMQTLDFFSPDFERFPALRLGLDVAASGGTAGAVVNAANESAVSAFLDGKLPFQEIVKVCRTILEHHNFEPHPTLEQLLRIDRWAREEAEKCLGKSS
jgi:1-deoxy-D-xylulose-5-phosphate reductoisomerase